MEAEDLDKEVGRNYNVERFCWLSPWEEVIMNDAIHIIDGDDPII